MFTNHTTSLNITAFISKSEKIGLTYFFILHYLPWAGFWYLILIGSEGISCTLSQIAF